MMKSQNGFHWITHTAYMASIHHNFSINQQDICRQPCTICVVQPTSTISTWKSLSSHFKFGTLKFHIQFPCCKKEEDAHGSSSNIEMQLLLCLTVYQLIDIKTN